MQCLGPTERRNDQTAWRWLALLRARWASNAEFDEQKSLPSHSVRELFERLETRLPASFRQRAAEEARTTAYQEFVAGK